MKNVILIGDSIRLGYEARVKELLGPDVTVYSPSENCRFTKYTLWGMWNWMETWGMPRPDVIHWNNGIWDLHRCTADGELFTPLPEYVEHNRRLAIQMESYCKNLIWATTIPGGRALDEKMALNPLVNTDDRSAQSFLCDSTDRWNADVRRYNEAVSGMLLARGVRIDDHYTAIIGDTDRYISDDGIHPSPEGYELLARLTAEEILGLL